MQPTELRFYRDESGLTAVSITYVNEPQENGIIERTELYIPSAGWFKEEISDLYDAVAEMVEMASEAEPEVGE